MDNTLLVFITVVITTLAVNFVHFITAVFADNHEDIVAPTTSAGVASAITVVAMILSAVALTRGAK